MIKKALLLTGIYPPDIGGPATYIPLLAKELVYQGYQVSIVTYSDAPSSKIYENGIKIEKIYRKTANSKILRFFIVVFKILKEMRGSALVFANGLYLETALAIKLSCRSGAVAKIVGDPVWERMMSKSNEVPNIGNFEARKIGSRAWILRRIYNQAFKQFGALTVPGISLQKLVNSWNSTFWPQVITNGVKVSSLTEHNKREFDVVFVGRLVKWKNVDILVDAIRNTGRSLAIVGEGPEHASLLKLARGSPNIKFLGKLNTEETEAILQRSKVCCLLSSYEGMSFTLLQAMACGCAVVVTDIEANNEVVREIEAFDTVVSMRDVQQTRSLILKLLNDEKLLVSSGLAGAKLVKERYEIGEKLQEMIRFIENH